MEIRTLIDKIKSDIEESKETLSIYTDIQINDNSDAEHLIEQMQLDIDNRKVYEHLMISTGRVRSNMIRDRNKLIDLLSDNIRTSENIVMVLEMKLSIIDKEKVTSLKERLYNISVKEIIALALTTGLLITGAVVLYHYDSTAVEFILELFKGK